MQVISKTRPIVSHSAFRMLIAAGVALLLALAFAVASPEPAHAASTNSKAVKAYSTMLAKKNLKWVDGTTRSSSLKFACQDINKDGVMDLVVYNPNAYDYEGFYRVYTYMKGKVKRVGTFYDLGVYSNKNFFVDSRAHMGWWHENYYRFDKNGKLVPLASRTGQELYPPDEGDYEVEWLSEDIPLYYFGWQVNGKAATSSEYTATVTALKQGAKDTLKFHANTAKNRTKYLKVAAPKPTLSATSKTLTKGKAFTLKVKNAGKAKVKWTSSNKKVATVSKVGKVTAKKAGKATITAKVGKKKLTCKVTVKNLTKAQKARQSLSGWWHTNSTAGPYMYVKNGKAYVFSTHFGDNGFCWNRTPDVKTTLKLTRVGKQSAYKIKVKSGGSYGGGTYYYFDGDRKTLQYGTGGSYSGSSSMYKCASGDVPSQLRKYVKRF